MLRALPVNPVELHIVGLTCCCCALLFLFIHARLCTVCLYLFASCKCHIWWHACMTDQLKFMYGVCMVCSSICLISGLFPYINIFAWVTFPELIHRYNTLNLKLDKSSHGINKYNAMVLWEKTTCYWFCYLLESGSQLLLSSRNVKQEEDVLQEVS